MNGYTGEFVKRCSVAAGRSFVASPSYYTELLRLSAASVGSAAPVPDYATAGSNTAAGDSAAARLRLEFKVLQNDVGLKARVCLYVEPTPETVAIRTLLTPLGGASSEIDVGGGAVVFFNMPNIPSFGPGELPTTGGAFMALVVDFQTTGSSGRAEVIVRTRPYAFPGWESANLVSASMLTAVEPAIIKSANGYQAAATSYASQMAEAKDEIARRLKANGIDLDLIPTDGVVVNRAGGPQNYAKYLIPELADAATHLALWYIHNRYTDAAEDRDDYKGGRSSRAFDEAFEIALRTIPYKLEPNWELQKADTKRGFVARLVI